MVLELSDSPGPLLAKKVVSPLCRMGMTGIAVVINTERNAIASNVH